MLDAVVHSRIIQDLEHICVVAGIQNHFLHESMTKYCGDSEVDWVRRFNFYRADGCPGLVLNGITRPDTRCQSMAAALIRNFVDARVVPLNTLIDDAKVTDFLTPTVLLVPNLFISTFSKQTPAWRAQVVYDLLLERAIHNKPSVVYVETLTGLDKVYGEPFLDFLSNFKIIKD